MKGGYMVKRHRANTSKPSIQERPLRGSNIKDKRRWRHETRKMDRLRCRIVTSKCCLKRTGEFIIQATWSLQQLVNFTQPP